jgi:hypothetical protein
MYIIKISFIEFLIPENIGIATKMMIIQLLYGEIWQIVGSRMIFLGFVATKKECVKSQGNG